MTSLHRVVVGVDPPYDVLVGPGALARVAEVVGDRRRVVVVSHPHLVESYGGALDGLWSAERPAWFETIEDGEGAKSLATIDRLCRAFAAGGLLRGDAVVALGGGVVGDTAGFAAAVFHRGVAVVQAPTTVLAQVDSAIGGKTAVNLPEGKNLVGAFHQPIAVVADTDTLATLPERDFRSGLGEVAKYALMPEGSALVDLLRLQVDRVLTRDAAVLGELVAACAAIKADVVAADPHERTGIRARLNFGHTFGHALETTTAGLGADDSAGIAHGEAVAIGLVFDVNLAHAMERVGLDVVDRVHGVVAGLGLPTEVPGELAAAALTDVMRRDKKSTGGLTFVVPGADGLGLVTDPPPVALEHAFRAVGVAT